jgi:hypothetical protein
LPPARRVGTGGQVLGSEGSEGSEVLVQRAGDNALRNNAAAQTAHLARSLFERGERRRRFSAANDQGE